MSRFMEFNYKDGVAFRFNFDTIRAIVNAPKTNEQGEVIGGVVKVEFKDWDYKNECYQQMRVEYNTKKEYEEAVDQLNFGIDGPIPSLQCELSDQLFNIGSCLDLMVAELREGIKCE